MGARTALRVPGMEKTVWPAIILRMRVDLIGMTAALRKSPCVPTATALRFLKVALEKFAWREQMLQMTPLLQIPTPLVQFQISLLQTSLRLTHAQAASLTVTTATTASIALAGAMAATTAPSVPLAAVGATTALVRGMEKNVWPAVTTCRDVKGMMAALRKVPCAPTGTSLQLLETWPSDICALFRPFLLALSKSHGGNMVLPVRISDLICMFVTRSLLPYYMISTSKRRRGIDSTEPVALSIHLIRIAFAL
jgi:hypothetical protein